MATYRWYFETACPWGLFLMWSFDLGQDINCIIRSRENIAALYVTKLLLAGDNKGRTWAPLNIKMSSKQYRDPMFPTVLSLTWESPYLGKTVFILRRDPGLELNNDGNQNPDVSFMSSCEWLTSKRTRNRQGIDWNLFRESLETCYFSILLSKSRKLRFPIKQWLVCPHFFSIVMQANNWDSFC